MCLYTDVRVGEYQAEVFGAVEDEGLTGGHCDSCTLRSSNNSNRSRTDAQESKTGLGFEHSIKYLSEADIFPAPRGVDCDGFAPRRVLIRRSIADPDHVHCSQGTDRGDGKVSDSSRIN